MNYTFQRDGTHLTVMLGGKLDASTSPELEDAMAKELEGITKITFDLARLEYISSAGLRILLASYKLMIKREGEMQVENVSGDVLDVLKMSGFAAVYGIA